MKGRSLWKVDGLDWMGVRTPTLWEICMTFESTELYATKVGGVRTGPVGCSGGNFKC